MKKFLMPLLIVSTSPISSALTFHPITGIAAPNMVDGNTAGNPLANIIQGPGVGFELAPPHARIGGTWYSDAPGGFPSDYLVSNPGDEIIILDLGADTTLFELSYWGYSSTNGNGMREFQLRFATDAEGGAPALGDESFGSSIPFNPAFTALNEDLPRQSLAFGQAINARYIEVKALNNYFNFVVGGDRLGIGEFSTAQPSVIGNPDIVPPGALDLALTPTAPTTHNIPLLNTGDLNLDIQTITFTGEHADAFSVVTDLPTQIAPFLSGPVQIQFDPSGLGGEITATAIVTSNDSDQSSIEILLTGSLPALGPNLVVTSPLTLALIESSVEDYSIPVTNGGGTPLTISGLTFTGTTAQAFTLVTLPNTIAPGGSDVVVIRFDPSAARPGAIDIVAHFTSNDLIPPTTDLVLKGGLSLTFHPVSAVMTNTVNFYSELNLISGIGTGFEASWPHASIGGGQPATWVTDAPNGGSGDYFDNAQTPPVIIFDLGSNVTLADIYTWGYAAGNTNGGKNFSLRFATEAEGGALGLGDENFGNAITYAPSFEAAFDPLNPTANAFAFPVSARYVEMTFTDNWKDLVGTLPGGDRVGLGEVAFPFFPGGDTHLKIWATERLSNGHFAITFSSAPGITYDLERSINGIDWLTLTATIIGGPDATSIITDTNTPADANLVLYRIIQR